MSIENILTIIGSYGFPICACICIGWFFAKTNDNYRNDLKELNASHKEEIKQLSDVVSQNTLVIQKLCDNLDDIKRAGT